MQHIFFFHSNFESLRIPTNWFFDYPRLSAIIIVEFPRQYSFAWCSRFFGIVSILELICIHVCSTHLRSFFVLAFPFSPLSNFLLFAFVRLGFSSCVYGSAFIAGHTQQHQTRTKERRKQAISCVPVFFAPQNSI